MLCSPADSDGDSLAAWRRRRVRRVQVLFVVALVGTALLVVTDRFGCFGLAGADRAGVEGRWSDVAQVGGGDGTGPVVRLRGGPEIGLLGLAEVSGRAHAAADAVRVWIGGGRVRVRFARGGTRNAAGRRVAYIETEDGVILNERLLARGLAVPQGAAAHPDAVRYMLLGRQARDDASRLASEADTPPLAPSGD